MFFGITWRLWNSDTWDVLESGYEIGGEISESFGPTYIEHQGVGMDAPIQQWVSGKQKTINLDLFFFAEFFTEDIIDLVEKLKSWTERDKFLKPPRPPRLLFDYGEAFLVPCKLDAVGSLRWEGGLRYDGTPRIARVPVVLRRWVDDIQYETTDPTRPPSSTVYHEVAQGETFEHIAARRYGSENALLGVLLRQDNPDKVDLRIGDVIEIPDLDKISPRLVQGSSPIFSGTEDAEEALSEYWDLRSGASSTSLPVLDPPTDLGEIEFSALFTVTE